MKIESFKDLKVWQLASALSKEVSKLVKTFPRAERYELVDDFIRAARSIPSNISEGFGRFHFSEKIQFYNIAKGSVLEVQNHLIEAKNNDYITETTLSTFSKRYHVVEVKLNNLIASTARVRKRYATNRKKK
jgi:four helix bundle protein